MVEQQLLIIDSNYQIVIVSTGPEAISKAQVNARLVS